MNSKLKVLLDHYSESHQNPQNTKIHKVAVPLIMLSLLGLLSQMAWSWGNAALIAIFLASLYYFQFRSLTVFVIIYGQVIPMMVWIHFNPFPPLVFYSAVFIFAWIAQFIGHHIEGKKPSFMQDLQYLLIGPIWIMKNFFRKT